MLELIPDRMAVNEEQDSTVDLLVRVLPPELEKPADRPPLNLSLVLDRSGSMHGVKMEMTRQAAGLAVRSLHPQDFVSVVLFDDRVETLLPSMSAAQAFATLHLLSHVDARGQTNLYDGWLSGGDQVARALDPGRMNRILLLTDGQANQGQTNPDRICEQVSSHASRGVRTTTIGFGRDYNEHLLKAMATSGLGNHFFVENPEQLRDFFDYELAGLSATVGTGVRLGVEPRGAVTVEVLMGPERTSDGALPFGDMVCGFPIQAVLRLRVPRGQGEVARFVLQWTDPREGKTHRSQATLSLPALPSAERGRLESHPLVVEQVTVAMAAQARREAMERLHQGNDNGAELSLQRGLELLRNVPLSPEVDFHLRDLDEMLQSLKRRDYSGHSKHGHMSRHESGHGYSMRKGMNLAEDVEEAVRAGLLPLRIGPLFRHSPPRVPAERGQAMMYGLGVGDALGGGGHDAGGRCLASEAGDLAALSRQLLYQKVYRPRQLAEAFRDARVRRPSPSLQHFQHHYRNEPLAAGARSAGAGALRRIAGVLEPFAAGYQRYGVNLWWHVAFMAGLTHRDCASTVACLAWSAVLWDLMGMTAPPPGDWYLRRFLEAAEGLETDHQYPSNTARHDGFHGTLTAHLRRLVPEARQRNLTASQAMREWGSGPYLIETVPCLLYILERHAHEPAEALRLALEESFDSATLGPLVGAALGALHGRAALPAVRLELEDRLLGAP
ncbi:MAG: ADP-ribosylglycohydrolase family protein [Candidatus Eremiobacterota bacterium]